MSDPEIEALQKSVTKAMAMGMPAPKQDYNSIPCHHKATCAPVSLANQEKGLANHVQVKPVRILKDTFESKIPMKWPVAGGHSTTYVARSL